MAGRPRKYFTEEDRKKAIQQSKNKHILNKEWRCEDCNNHNYTMAGKWRDLNTKKHKINADLNEQRRENQKEYLNDINYPDICKRNKSENIEGI